MCVNNLPKVVTWKHESKSWIRDLQSDKSGALTTTPPGHTVNSHPEYCPEQHVTQHTTYAVFVWFRVLQADKGMVCEQLKILIGRNLIKEMEPDKWVRNVLDKTTGTTLC